MWKAFVSSRVQELEQQNARLREALETMRTEYAAAERCYQSAISERNKAWSESAFLLARLTALTARQTCQ